MPSKDVGITMKRGQSPSTRSAVYPLLPQRQFECVCGAELHDEMLAEMILALTTMESRQGLQGLGVPALRDSAILSSGDGRSQTLLVRAAPLEGLNLVLGEIQVFTNFEPYPAAGYVSVDDGHQRKVIPQQGDGVSGRRVAAL